MQVEQDLQKLAADARRARQTLEDQMVEFERKKIEDVKVMINTLASRLPLSCFLEFPHTAMENHVILVCGLYPFSFSLISMDVILFPPDSIISGLE